MEKGASRDPGMEQGRLDLESARNRQSLIWEEWTRDYRKMLMGYYRKSRADADDLTQEALRRLFGNIDRVRNPASLRAFRMQILRNVVYDNAAKGRERRERECQVSQLQPHQQECFASQVARTASPEQRVQIRMLREKIILAIQEITGYDLGRCEDIVRYRTRDISAKQLAYSLGCSEVAARVKVKRLLEKLKDLINEE